MTVSNQIFYICFVMVFSSQKQAVIPAGEMVNITYIDIAVIPTDGGCSSFSLQLIIRTIRNDLHYLEI